MRHASFPPIALTIAGSDSAGGAGIQADLRTFQAFGVYGCSALTAVTAQNTLGVQVVRALPAHLVQSQINSVLSDLPVSAIKLGMLATPALARVVHRALMAAPNLPLVCDPVLIATTGATLTDHAVLPIYRSLLIPRADVLTPNLPEAEALLQRRIVTRSDMLEAAQALLASGARAVLLKGGHLDGKDVHDLYLEPALAPRWFSARKQKCRGHGTGCTLAAAIAAGLAHGQSSLQAVSHAIAYMRRQFGASAPLGHGKLSVVLPEPVPAPGVVEKHD